MTTDADVPEPSSSPPETAMGAETLLGDAEAARDRGYTEQFVVRDDGDVDCGHCGQALNPAAILVDHFRRLEGASDAADLAMSAWVECPVCGARGVLTLGYGPNSSESEGRVLDNLSLRRADADTAD